MKQINIDIGLLVESNGNPREKKERENIGDLIESIKEIGILQPITVRKKGFKYEIICGHRRYWAAKELGMKQILANVITIKDEEIPIYQTIENVQRADLHPIKQSEVFIALETMGKSIVQIASSIGKKPSYVAQLLQLKKLTKPARDRYMKNEITLEHALALAKLPDKVQIEAIEWLMEDHCQFVKGKEFLIAKDIHLLRDWINEHVDMVLSSAPFSKDDKNLIPGVPACVECPKNSGFNTALFPELKGDHVCNDRTCFKAKMEAYQKMMHVKTRKEEKMPFIMISHEGYIGREDPRKIKDVKMSGRYRIVKKGDKCEDTKKAQWIDGPNAGKFTLVCNYSYCKKHWKIIATRNIRNDYKSPENEAKRKAAEEKIDKRISLENRCRDEILKEIIKKVPDTIDYFVLKQVAVRIANNPQGREIKSLPDSQLMKKLVDLLFLNDYSFHVQRYNMNSKSRLLTDFAMYYKIDEQKIRDIVCKQIKGEKA